MHFRYITNDYVAFCLLPLLKVCQDEKTPGGAFPGESTRTTWRTTSLSEGRLQMQAEEATGATNSGGEREPPLRFHYPREFFLSMAGKTVSGVARNFIFSPIPAPFTDCARLERRGGISMTGLQVSSFTYVRGISF